MPRHTKCCTCHAKSSQQTWRSDAPKCNPSQEILLTAVMNMSLVLRLPREMHLAISSAYVPRLPSFLKLLQSPHILRTSDKVHNPLRLPRETTSERPKVLRTLQLFALLTSKFASRQNGVHFFDISTSKNGPNMRCFARFDFQMCCVPQRRALFRHPNFQKCSEPVSFLHFWVLRATTACNFSSLIWPHGSAPAALAYFSTLRSHKWLEKHSVSRLSYLFAHLDLLSSHSFSFRSSFFFSSLLFSDSSHLCFWSLTSKLPSVKDYKNLHLCPCRN